MNTENIQFGLTYDDVLLIPDYSEVLPREVDIATRLTKNIDLNIPIVSAAMDTITEADLAIALAREGGIGILHKNLTIEQQADMVQKVKRSESGMISDPITLHADQTVADARELTHKYKFGGFPVVDQSGRLIGIVTNRDMRLDVSERTPIEDIMTAKGLVTAPAGTSLTEAEKILHNPSRARG